jgi:hypothetical protein
MKVIGKEVHIQRGETWTLDFELQTESGHPYIIPKEYQNPYLVITIAGALYEQTGDFRRSYWLDLDRRDVEQADGSILEEPIKRFVSSTPLWLPHFAVDQVLAYYAGEIVADPTSERDITNFLFFTDEAGVRTYKYLKSYTVDIDEDGDIDQDDEVWEEYSLHICKPFDTKDWMESRYLFDMKVLAGEKIEDYVARLIGETVSEDLTDELLGEWIAKIEDPVIKEKVQAAYEVGMPLAPTFDAKALILEPTYLYVSANIQGGIR